MIHASIWLSSNNRLRLLILKELADVFDRGLISKDVVLYRVNRLKIDLSTILSAMLTGGLRPTSMREYLTNRVSMPSPILHGVISHDHGLRLIKCIVNS